MYSCLLSVTDSLWALPSKPGISTHVVLERQCHSASVYCDNWMVTISHLAYMGMKTELLYSEPRFPNGSGDSSPKRTLKGRYFVFKYSNMQSVSWPPAKVRTVDNGPLWSVVRPRGKDTQGHSEGSSPGQPSHSNVFPWNLIWTSHQWEAAWE